MAAEVSASRNAGSDDSPGCVPPGPPGAKDDGLIETAMPMVDEGAATAQGTSPSVEGLEKTSYDPESGMPSLGVARRSHHSSEGEALRPPLSTANTNGVSTSTSARADDFVLRAAKEGSAQLDAHAVGEAAGEGRSVVETQQRPPPTEKIRQCADSTAGTADSSVAAAASVATAQSRTREVPLTDEVATPPAKRGRSETYVWKSWSSTRLMPAAFQREALDVASGSWWPLYTVPTAKVHAFADNAGQNSPPRKRGGQHVASALERMKRLAQKRPGRRRGGAHGHASQKVQRAAVPDGFVASDERSLTGLASAIRYSRDGSLLAIGSRDGSIGVYSMLGLRTLQRVFGVRECGSVSALAWSSDASILAVATYLPKPRRSGLPQPPDAAVLTLWDVNYAHPLVAVRFDGRARFVDVDPLSEAGAYTVLISRSCGFASLTCTLCCRPLIRQPSSDEMNGDVDPRDALVVEPEFAAVPVESEHEQGVFASLERLTPPSSESAESTGAAAGTAAGTAAGAAGGSVSLTNAVLSADLRTSFGPYAIAASARFTSDGSMVVATTSHGAVKTFTVSRADGGSAAEMGRVSVPPIRLAAVSHKEGSGTMKLKQPTLEISADNQYIMHVMRTGICIRRLSDLQLVARFKESVEGKQLPVAALSFDASCIAALPIPDQKPQLFFFRRQFNGDMRVRECPVMNGAYVAWHPRRPQLTLLDRDGSVYILEHGFKSDYPGPMYPPNFKLLIDNKPYHEVEDEFDKTDEHGRLVKHPGESTCEVLTTAESDALIVDVVGLHAGSGSDDGDEDDEKGATGPVISLEIMT